MATDAYLQFDGIKGESTDTTHQGWIEITAAHFGVVQPRSATASTGGGHTAERCEHRTISVSKLADLASPVLMQTCSMGRTIPKAKLEFMRADSDAQHPQVTKIYFNDDVVQQAIGAGRVRSWDGHNDHIHIEVKEFP